MTVEQVNKEYIDISFVKCIIGGAKITRTSPVTISSTEVRKKERVSDILPLFFLHVLVYFRAVAKKRQAAAMREVHIMQYHHILLNLLAN